MQKLLFLIIPLSFGCSGESEKKSVNNQNDLINQIVENTKHPKCPENHTDSIIPIVYGYPSNELIAQSDSGLVALGGCEIGKENWYCKLHKISF